jgi:uncharacterized membrane protein
MASVLDFLKTTVIGGMLFLFPFVALVLVGGKALEIMRQFLKPVVDQLGLEVLFGLEISVLLAIVLLVGLCFVCGTIAQTDAAMRLVERIEKSVLARVPGYEQMKFLSRSVILNERDVEGSVVLVRFEEDWQLGMLAEPPGQDNFVSVFFPDSPTLQSGPIKFVAADRIKQTDFSMENVLAFMKTRGAGGGEISRLIAN